MAEIEYNTLKKCYGSLTTHFAASNLISLEAGLVEKELISFEVSIELNSLGGPQAKAKKMAQSVILSVNAKPALFSEVIAVLEKNNLSELATILQDKKSKRITDGCS